MNLLVTGAAGFIGSHVCDRLLADGHRVVVLDDFDPFYPASLEALFVADAERHEAFTLIEGGVRPSIADPVRYESVNVGGTQQLLGAARRGPTGSSSAPPPPSTVPASGPTSRSTSSPGCWPAGSRSPATATAPPGATTPAWTTSLRAWSPGRTKSEPPTGFRVSSSVIRCRFRIICGHGPSARDRQIATGGSER